MPRRNRNTEKERGRSGKPKAINLGARKTASEPTLEVHGRRFIAVELDHLRRNGGGCCPFCEAVGQWICKCGAINDVGDPKCSHCGGRRDWLDIEDFR